MNFKSLPWEVKADIDKRTFEGYASNFGNIDLHGDIIVQGAFTKTINERMPKKAIKLLWQHFDPLGMPQVLEEDSKGLYVKGAISKTTLGNEALVLMKDGVVDGMSIGFDIIKDEWDPDHNIRYLKELKLYEVSIVTWGANPEAMVTSVKHLHAMKDIFKDENLKSLADVSNQLKQLNERLEAGVFGTKDGQIIINMDEIKAGKVLSKKNRDNLTNAVQLIQTVLETDGENDDKDKQKNNIFDDGEFKDLLQEIRSYRKNS